LVGIAGFQDLRQFFEDILSSPPPLIKSHALQLYARMKVPSLYIFAMRHSKILVLCFSLSTISVICILLYFFVDHFIHFFGKPQIYCGGRQPCAASGGGVAPPAIYLWFGFRIFGFGYFKHG
jgi:hypothetical protein